MFHEARTGNRRDRPCKPALPGVSSDGRMSGRRNACGVRDAPVKSHDLRRIGFVAVFVMTVCPHLAWANGWNEKDPAGVLLANVTPLTADEMAHENAGASPAIVALPNTDANQPKVHLWDELGPSAALTLQNGSSGVSVHFGP